MCNTVRTLRSRKEIEVNNRESDGEALAAVVRFNLTRALVGQRAEPRDVWTQTPVCDIFVDVSTVQVGAGVLS